MIKKIIENKVLLISLVSTVISVILRNIFKLSLFEFAMILIALELIGYKLTKEVL